MCIFSCFQMILGMIYFSKLYIELWFAVDHDVIAQLHYNFS